MKTSRLLLILAGLLLLNSCEKDNDSEFADYLVATPLTMSVEQFEAAVDIFPPQPLTVSGKIYAFGDRIFVNEPFKGIHMVDNQDPSAPRKTGFINIPGNVDIAVKDDYLFADSLSDLVVFDISNPDNIRPVARLKGVLQDHVPWPFEADIVEYDGWNAQDEILVGWEMQTQRLSVSEVEGRNQGQVDFLEAAADNASGTGQGGSLARFKIVEDFLYAVDSHTINVFDISNLEAPVAGDDVFAGFDIETIFNRGDHLFLGSMRGMYIFDISNPAAPAFVSEFQHGTACDPVVVDGDYAFVTLRGGNGCGATESGLFIVDISDIHTPELLISYPMDEPYGLGIRGEQLFICDGASGLKVYDKSNVTDLQQLAVFDDVNPYDVIPLEDHLLMVGEGLLSQYRYTEAGLEFLSALYLAD